MKTTVLKITAAIALLTVAGGSAFAAIYDDSAEEQNTHTQVKSEGTQDTAAMQLINAGMKISEVMKKANADKKAPVLTAEKMTVTVGEKIDIFDGVKAVDDQDGDLTKRIVSNKELDTSKVGKQVIRFSATDDSANVGWLDRTFEIIEPKLEPEEAVEPQEAAMEEIVVPEVETAPAVTEAPVEEVPTVQHTETVEGAAPETPAAPAYQAMTMYINGLAIPYQNGGQGSGQSIIDANPNGVVATWGGAAVQSGSDGMNTHFIGHNPGIFSALFGLGGGSQIIVTDSTGTPTTYTVSSTAQIDDYGKEIGTGNNLWDLTVGTGGGERITLQTCINDDVNLFVFAYK